MVRDFMSYCGPQWIGPYHYRALLSHPLFNPRHLVEPGGPKLPDWVDKSFSEKFFTELERPRPPGPVEIESALFQYPTSPVQRLMLVTGLMEGGQIERLSVLRLPTRVGTTGAVVPGIALEVRNGQGALVNRVRLHRVPLLASGCGCCGGGQRGFEPEPGFESGLVQAMLPDRADIGEVRIVRDEAILWSRRADDEAPEFGEVLAQIESNELQVRWVVRGASADTYFVVRWSSDYGEDWEALTVVPGTTEPCGEPPHFEARVAVAALRPGPALVEVVAVEGLHTVISDPVEVSVPDGPPCVAIVWPREGSVVLNSEPVRLWGVVVSASGERLDGAALHWTLDGRSVGQGSAAEGELGDWEGEHRATLTVHTAQGTVEASVTFLATCSGDPSRQYRRQ